MALKLRLLSFTIATTLVVCSTGESCEGTDLRFVGNTRAFEISQPSIGNRWTIPAIEGTQTAADFAQYDGLSSHTGFESKSRSFMFLYRNLETSALSLFWIHGVKGGGDGRVVAYILGVPDGTKIALADEEDEFGWSDAKIYDYGEPLDADWGGPPTHKGVYHDGDYLYGNWEFSGNTDGMVIENLPEDSIWKLRVCPYFEGRDIKEWKFFFGNGVDHELNPEYDLYIRPLPTYQNDVLPFPVTKGEVQTFCALALDNSGMELKYEFNWGDKKNSRTVIISQEGALTCATHTFCGDQVQCGIHTEVRKVVLNVYNEACGSKVTRVLATEAVNTPPPTAPPSKAPLTNGPPTPKPSTQAPPTAQPPVSPTRVPPTRPPLTAAPPTSVPPTLVPPTTAPATHPPKTKSPPTKAPMSPTPVPRTPQPPQPTTPVPSTHVPPPAATPAPPTPQPPQPTTPVPSTHVPPPAATPAPPTPQPTTPVPSTQVPPPPPTTPVPSTQVLSTQVPPPPPTTPVPSTQVPSTLVPSPPPTTPVPSTQVPSALVPPPPTTPVPSTQAPTAPPPPQPTPVSETSVPAPALSPTMVPPLSKPSTPVPPTEVPPTQPADQDEDRTPWEAGGEAKTPESVMQAAENGDSTPVVGITVGVIASLLFLCSAGYAVLLQRGKGNRTVGKVMKQPEMRGIEDLLLSEDDLCTGGIDEMQDMSPVKSPKPPAPSSPKIQKKEGRKAGNCEYGLDTLEDGKDDLILQ